MDDRPVVRSFVSELLRRNLDTAPFGDADSLIAGGRLASIDVLDIVEFLEERYKIDFSVSGFDQNRLDSINDIVGLIEETLRA